MGQRTGGSGVSEFRTPKGTYDYFPALSHVTKSGDGSAGEGRPRAWDNSKRPVNITITTYRGHPHWFVRLDEAENPYLGLYDGHEAWISEYDDPLLRGRCFSSPELDSRDEALAWAEETYRENFDPSRYVLFRRWSDAEVVNIRDLFEKEGD